MGIVYVGNGQAKLLSITNALRKQQKKSSQQNAQQSPARAPESLGGMHVYSALYRSKRRGESLHIHHVHALQSFRRQ